MQSNSNIPPGPGASTASASASAESDGEEERSKNADCNSAPKVPPLKIFIPQGATPSEQEQGSRNSKNTSTRGGHQLPYIVATSNSNDSMEKDESITAATGGTNTNSPLETGSGATSKTDEKKDFNDALDLESRSTHRQRVLRSSYRSGNGDNDMVLQHALICPR